MPHPRPGAKPQPQPPRPSREELAPWPVGYECTLSKREDGLHYGVLTVRTGGIPENFLAHHKRQFEVLKLLGRAYGEWLAKQKAPGSQVPGAG